jgi:hypothetical protein
MSIILPRLVNEIIGWYQWKAKIRRLNIDFLVRSYYLDGGRLTVWFTHNNFLNFHYRISQLYPMRHDAYIRRIYHDATVSVAILPLKYYFSSGSHNSQSFLSKEYPHNRLPDFCRFF